MPISAYLRNLRAKIGHAMILMPGISAVVMDDAGRILLQRTTDDGRWYLLGGAMDPGEEPADAAVREVWEETGIRVIPEWLISVETMPTQYYPNGDQVSYVAINFLCRPVDGQPHAADDESLEVRYFALDELPELRPRDRVLIEQTLRNEPHALFQVTISAK